MSDYVFYLKVIAGIAFFAGMLRYRHIEKKYDIPPEFRKLNLYRFLAIGPMLIFVLLTVWEQMRTCGAE